MVKNVEDVGGMKVGNRLSFNQAAGKVRELKDNLASGKFKRDVEKQINDESKISVASPNDRRAYLLNAINGMDEATADGERVFYIIAQEVKGVFSRKQIGRFLKEILRAKIDGHSNKKIAKYFGKSEKAIEALEELGKLELKTHLEIKGFTDDTPSDKGLIIP